MGKCSKVKGGREELTMKLRGQWWKSSPVVLMCDFRQ